MFCRRGPAILAAMRPDLSSDSCGRGRLALFAALFWGALLVSLARFGVDGFDASWTWGLMLGAVATGLLVPGRAAVQFGAHVLHLLAFACAAPHYSNFHTAAAFTSLAAVVCLGGRRDDPRRIVQFQTATLLALALIYAFAAFIKLNATFFDPALSPVRAYMEKHPLLTSTASDPVVLAVAVLTVTAEFLIPLCLLVPRLRLAAIALDVAMHIVFAFRVIPPSLNFPMLALALCSLWIPEEGLARWRERLPRALRFLQWGLLVLAAIVALPKLGFFPKPLANSLLIAAWLAVAVLLAAWMVALIRASPRGGTTFSLAWTPRTVLLAALVALNGLAPYAGFRTLASYEMFSGYLHLGGRTNHLLVPAEARRFPYVDRWVHVHETSHPRLAHYAGRDLVISWTHFRRLAADGLHHRATFSDSGRLRQLDRLDADPALARPLAWWERRLVNTMAVPYPRLAELGLLPPGETRPPHAADTLALSIP